MTREEKSAIEKAIVRGIEEALKSMFVNPFPPEGDPNTQIFHAKPNIKLAIRNELNQIKITLSKINCLMQIILVTSLPHLVFTIY